MLDIAPRHKWRIFLVIIILWASIIGIIHTTFKIFGATLVHELVVYLTLFIISFLYLLKNEHHVHRI